MTAPLTYIWKWYSISQTPDPRKRKFLHVRFDFLVSSGCLSQCLREGLVFGAAGQRPKYSTTAGPSVHATACEKEVPFVHTHREGVYMEHHWPEGAKKLHGPCTDVLTNIQAVIQTVIETTGIYGTDVQMK